ncbi:Na+/H+ antiporter subunit E [Pontiella sp.]|uniref:Na+/H+ antiporter subunit E n=1 Tax=Pontiella sp. TaxID=2837462 RepID=UPI00356AEE73
MSGPFILAFGIWMLLTADFSRTNALAGLVAAALVALLPKHRFSAWQLFRLILSVLIRVPMAIWESACIVFIPHPNERISTEKIQHPQNRWSIFCQSFIITFTPRSLVVSEDDDEIRIHSLEPGDPS